MRFVAILFAVMTLGVFAIVATFDTGPATVNAGPLLDTSTPACGDDGDEGDGDPADDPDSDDGTLSLVFTSDDDDVGSEPADNEDKDPTDEYDDCYPFEPDPTLLGETQTPEPTDSPMPSATPCPTYQYGASGDECCIIPAGLSAQVPSCYCDLGPGYCDVANVIAPSDFDCDGQTTTADALGTLNVIASSESEEGDSEDPADSCPDSEDLPGDADCDDEIGTKDAIAILSIVAGFVEDEEDCSD